MQFAICMDMGRLHERTVIGTDDLDLRHCTAKNGFGVVIAVSMNLLGPFDEVLCAGFEEIGALAQLSASKTTTWTILTNVESRNLSKRSVLRADDRYLCLGTFKLGL